MSEAWLLAFSMIDGLVLLCLTVYCVITLSDLECDYINAKTCCSKLNQMVIPELGLQIACAVAMLLAGHFILFLLNLPLILWHIFRYSRKPSGDIGIYDPAEIHNRHLLKSYMKESLVKLGHHLIFFFLYLYSNMPAGPCLFNPAWLKKDCYFGWLVQDKMKLTSNARCSICLKTFGVRNLDEADLKSHMNGQKNEQLVQPRKPSSSNKEGLGSVPDI